MPSCTIRTMLLALLVALPGVCAAQMPRNITDADMALAPPYCPDTMSFSKSHSYNPDARQKRWVQMMGQAFWAMHHYCWAMININRAARPLTPARERDNLYNRAIGDIDYVLRNSPPDFVLRPELYTKRGELLAKLKKYPDAVTAYRQAFNAKPDYWPAYTGLADMLRVTGHIDKAREIVEDGLMHAPSSKALNSMLAELKAAGAKTPPPGREASREKKGPKTDVSRDREAPKTPDAPRQQDPEPPRDAPPKD